MARHETKERRSSVLDSRAFTVGLMIFSGLGIPFTGVANHLYQAGPMDLARHAWMAAHNAPGAVFLLSAVAHALLHRRRIAQVFRAAVRRGRARASGREAALAAALVAAVLVAAVGHTWLS